HILVELDTRISSSREEGSNDNTTGLTTRYTFPNVQLLDYNGDGLPDLIATREDRVTVYLQQSDGSYETTASTDHLFDVRTQEEKIEAYADIETLVEDLDGNGYADAVVTKQTMKGITNIRGVVNIFWGGPDGYAAEPDQLIISEGTASVGAIFLDVNGDGRKDLVLPSIKFSIAAIIRILMTRSIKVYFNIFLLNEDGRISERPDFTKEVKFKIDFSGESDEQAMDLEGDYNGDKRTDFVFATGKNELSVYLGEPAGEDDLFSKRPVAKIEADAYGELSSADLNGDGYRDMIIYYPENKDLKGTLEVLINRGTL
ncbi:MAG: VCBS repeat-containing protein, partial [bacterium]